MNLEKFLSMIYQLNLKVQDIMKRLIFKMYRAKEMNFKMN
jgi:hypothetical protein